MKLGILKCHGSGNDFILIDETVAGNEAIQDETRAHLTKTLCDREDGIGSDGILFYQPAESADCRMRIFNSDGSEAEMCGNGLRCIGRYCSERLMKPEVTVETMKAILPVRREKQIFAGIETFEAEIGPVSLLQESLPMSVDSGFFIDEIIEDLSNDLKFTAISVPNPHIVTIVTDIDEVFVAQCGDKANHLSLFPKGVNVSFFRPLGENRIFVVTYERGVGVTYSCGTAMSASAYVSMLQGISEADQPISVYNKGGMVECDVSNRKGNILLKGNATFVYEATIDVKDGCGSIEYQYKSKVRLDEISAYGILQDYAKSILEKTA